MFTTSTLKGILFYDENDPEYFKGAILQGDEPVVLHSYDWQQILDGFLSTAILNDACSRIDGVYAIVRENPDGFIIARSSVHEDDFYQNPWDVYDITFPEKTVGAINVFKSKRIPDEWCAVLYAPSDEEDILLGSQVDISGELTASESMSSEELLWAGQFLPIIRNKIF